MKRVLFLCTGNSCRSQMAEALWRHHAGGEWQSFSAGSHPAGFVHPLALKALEERGVPAGNARSKSMDEFREASFDRVITVCDDARDACPVLPGAARQDHWSFKDPARATGTEELRLECFREVCGQIEVCVRAALGAEAKPEAAAKRYKPLAFPFRDWLRQVLDQWPGPLPAERRREYASLADRTAEILIETDAPWDAIPPLILDLFGDRGWRWNGFFSPRGRVLTIGPAAGPPVCADLERRGDGIGSSGMCWDALLLNQTVCAPDVSLYPGYVSCDETSGLKTVAGIVCPIRDRRGKPVAVWDLDSIAPLAAEDPVFLDRYFATLSVLVRTYPSPSFPADRARDSRPAIRLAQFLKHEGLVETGGRAKVLIQAGEVKVNGVVEIRRGKQLRPGDRVELGGTEYRVTLGERPPS